MNFKYVSTSVEHLKQRADEHIRLELDHGIAINVSVVIKTEAMDINSININITINTTNIQITGRNRIIG